MLTKSLKDKKVLVIGLGMSGQSAVRFLLKRGVKVTGVDGQRQLAYDSKILELKNLGMIFFFEDDLDELQSYDLVVVSPGISTEHVLYRKALEAGVEIIGEVELACREMCHTCLGVTGTNGKTTVTLLTEHVLKTAGVKAKSLGNMGVPLTSVFEELPSEDTVFVIELSSFQLETLSARFIDAGVILNITPDHLDRYASMKEYAAAKVGMKKNIKEKGVLFVEEKCLKNFGELFGHGPYQGYGYSPDSAIYTDLENVYCNREKMFSFPDSYKGKWSHDLENVMAAYALCSTQSISPEEFLKALTSFQKPSHRIEFVRTVDGVNFYDDSKGTNIDAVIRAVEGLKGQVILIAGGVDKGFSYSSWIGAFKGKVRAICAMGQSKEKIKQDIGNEIPVILFSEFEQAVVHAASLANKEDNVLLSPGCSSFDMFKDYAHRGQEFQRIVNAL